MIDAIEPWVRCAFGAWLIVLGYRWTRHPNRFVGHGVIPITVLRTIRGLGIVAILVGAMTIASYFSKLIPE